MLKPPKYYGSQRLMIIKVGDPIKKIINWETHK